MEKAKQDTTEKPISEVDDNAAEIKDTTPITDNKEILIPIKFNKEVKDISLEKASELAQKGLKFDAISQDYENLKSLAKEDGKSVGEFIRYIETQKNENREKELLEKCGGDNELAHHIMELENTDHNDDMGFQELSTQFQSIKNLSDLPEEVIENARLKGTLLLDEYLRYKLLSHNKAKAAEASVAEAEKTSVGPQFTHSAGDNPETAEFLKGLWK